MGALGRCGAAGQWISRPPAVATDLRLADRCEDGRVDLNELLVGHWSSVPFSYGVMEASELGLLGDGRGWSAWFNADSLCVTRLRWHCPEPGVLELREQWTVAGELGGTAGPLAFAGTEPPVWAGEVTRHRYTIGSAVPMPDADPLPAITFEEAVEFCHTFARGPREITPEEDPSHRVPPPAGR